MNIRIDTDKILNDKSKFPFKIKKMYSDLCKFPSPRKHIEYVSALKESSRDIIKDNIHTLYECPSASSVDFLKCVLETFDLTESDLNKYKEGISSRLESYNETTKTEMNSVLSLIDSKLKDFHDTDSIKNEIKLKLAKDRFINSCLYESYLDKELEILMYNINNSYEAVSDLEMLIRKIRLSKTSEYFSSYPQLLVNNTELIRILKTKVSGDVLDLVTCLPVEMARKLVELKANKSIKKNYIYMLDKQALIISKDLKEGDSTKYGLYTEYLRKLNYAHDIVADSIDGNKSKSIYKLNENLAEMQPDIIMYDECCAEDIVAEMDELMTDILFEEDEDKMIDLFENFARVSGIYTDVLEGKLLTKAANKVASGVRAVSNKTVAAAKGAGRIKTAVKKSVDPFERTINNLVNKIREEDRKERTEKILSGQYTFSVGKAIRKAIMLIASGALLKSAPVIGAITLLTSFAVNKYLDDKQRKRIISELEAELKMVDEKLDDAKSDGERQKKYELMRIKMKLEKDIERVKYKLN